VEKQLFAGGWAVVTWPEVYGGRDCSLIEWLIFEEEYYAAGGPFRISANGVTLLGPTLFEFGYARTEGSLLAEDGRVAKRSGRRVGPNRTRWSDLAGIKTKAIRDGEWFVSMGKRPWTTRGAFAIGCLYLPY
jgi:alkylation response protein AidB-like acyl-CoA dehydrogenase